jgi:hypothetical protein
MVSFTPRPLYSGGRNPRYTVGSRQGVSHDHYGCGGDKKNLYPCREWKAGPASPSHCVKSGMPAVAVYIKVSIPNS